MCGRFTQITKKNNLEHEFGIEIFSNEDLSVNYNVAPSQTVNVVFENENNARQLTKMKWGFTPNWSKTDKINFNTINARLETIESSPLYKDSMKKKRCIIPASGFFEWKKGSTPKQPYYIYPADLTLFAFAALYDTYRTSRGSLTHSFTIITTESSKRMSGIHHRMPLLLTEHHYSNWLNNMDSIKPDDINKIRTQGLEIQIQYHPVSTYVNKVENNSSETMDEIQLIPEWEF